MSSQLIKFAFAAGELSPQFHGRVDLEKFDMGVALGRNFFVSHKGPLVSRFGLQHLEPVDAFGGSLMFPFQFNFSVANTYLIMVGSTRIFFLQDGSYILRPAVAVTAVTNALPGVFTAVAHGMFVDEYVKLTGFTSMPLLNNRTFSVRSTPTADTFTLDDDITGTVDTTTMPAYGGGGQIQSSYSIASPYNSDDFSTIKADQIRDVLRITSNNYVTKNLRRISDTNWTLTDLDLSNPVTRPSGLAFSASAAGSAGVIFAVTAVNLDGLESLLSDYEFCTSIVNYSTTAGSITLTWNKVAGTSHYNIYRSIIYTDGSKMTRAAQLGFLGRSYGPVFTDNNIIPDFTTGPPQANNPFADGKIEHIDVTAGGAGYTNASALTVTEGGASGFIGYPVVEGGVIVAVVVVNGGQGYSAPAISADIGAGATFTATIGEATGNNPRTSTLFQQRQLFAGTPNDPLVIQGSRPGQFDNFDFSEIASDGDAYEHEIDSKIVAFIRHMVPTRIGLIVMTRAGIWLLHGSSGGSVTATDAQSDPHPFNGVSAVPPLKIDAELVYCEAKGGTVRMLSYNDITKAFNGADISILSSHLLGRDKEIVEWAYAAEPHKMVFAVREDGLMLCITVVKEQEVFAWTQAATKGWFRNVVSLQEGNEDVVYAVVERPNIVNSDTHFTLERVIMRDVEELEDIVCLDNSLTLPQNFPSTTARLSGYIGTVTLDTDSPSFVIGDVGKIFRGGGAKGTVTAFIDTKHVTVSLASDVTIFIPETTTPAPMLEGSWSLDTLVSSVSGLWHLEGETVRIVADGNLHTDKIVVDGTVTLDVPATVVAVGLPFTCVMKSLPINSSQSVVDDKRRRVMKVAARVWNSRGLKSGRTLDKLYEVKERTTEPLGEPTRLQTGMQHVHIEPQWNDDGQFYIVQDGPFPVTLLGFVADTEVGDDPD